MLKNILLQCAIAIQLGAFLAGNSHALEKMTAGDIQALCADFNSGKPLAEEPGDESGKALCIMYIKGFLSGEEIHRSHHKPKPTYEERAMKTRVAGLLDKMESPGESGYCIPESITPEDIASLVNREPTIAENPAEKLMETVLRRNFQCVK